MHTARSRNDLGSTMLRMNVRDTLMKIIPMVYELEKVLLHMAEENKDKLLKDYPFWATDVIAGGTYDCVPDDYKTIAFWNCIVADKDLSEDLVYKLTKTTFENLDYLLNVDVAAAGISTDNLNVMVTPLHPGAYKYYTEIGLNIPDNLKPVG